MGSSDNPPPVPQLGECSAPFRGSGLSWQRGSIQGSGGAAGKKWIRVLLIVKLECLTLLSASRMYSLGARTWTDFEALSRRDGDHGGEHPALVLPSSVRVALSHVEDLTQGEVPMTEVQEMKEVRGRFHY